jgi:hypothetical protein
VDTEIARQRRYGVVEWWTIFVALVLCFVLIVVSAFPAV